VAKETETDKSRLPPVPAVRGDVPDVHRWWITAAALATLLAIVGLTGTLAWGLRQPLPFSEPSGSILPSNARDAAVWTSATLLILVPASALIPWVERMLRGRWGEGWGWLGAAAVRLHERRRTDLIKRASTKGGPSSSAVLGSALHLLYPSSGVLRPTALGNVLAAVDERVAGRHDGLPLVAVWPRLRRFLSEAERAALDARERRTQAMLAIAAGSLIALGFTFAIFIASGVLVLSWPLLIGPLAAYIAGQGAYRAAVNAAVLEGVAVEAAVDVHLEAFLEAIGMSAADAKSRRQAFAALFDPVTSVEETLQKLGIAGSRDVITDRLMSDIRRSVQDEVASSLPGAIAGPVAAAVRASFREFVEGEPLVNYDGVLSVGLRNGHGESVPIGDDRRVVLDDGLSYQLDVTIGPRGARGAATEPLSIGTGVDEEFAPFEVAVDSDVRGLRQTAVPLHVGPGDTRDVTFPFNVGVPPPSWIWIRVAQRGRTVQNLELSTTSRQTEDRT
jgi:hypothetical protein